MALKIKSETWKFEIWEIDFSFKTLESDKYECLVGAWDMTEGPMI